MSFFVLQWQQFMLFEQSSRSPAFKRSKLGKTQNHRKPKAQENKITIKPNQNTSNQNKKQKPKQANGKHNAKKHPAPTESKPTLRYPPGFAWNGPRCFHELHSANEVEGAASDVFSFCVVCLSIFFCFFLFLRCFWWFGFSMLF